MKKLRKGWGKTELRRILEYLSWLSIRCADPLIKITTEEAINQAETQIKNLIMKRNRRINKIGGVK